MRLHDPGSPAPLPDAALWARLEAFPLDDATSELTFTRKLARENGWSVGHARRVTFEYRRFVYLCMTAGHPCGPSDAVDQAWHLHLLYTRSYWDHLCGEVLGRPLHHGPTKGGTAEHDKHEAMYEETLASYRGIFGADPPADLWPPAAVRFGRDLAFVRVNLRNYVVIPRSPLALLARFGSVVRGLAWRLGGQRW